MENEQFSIKLTDMLKAIKKRYYIFILICLITISSAVIYGKNNFNNYYETSTTIIIGDSTNDQVKAFNIQDEKYINTYAKLFKTDIVAEKAIEKLSLNVSTDILKKNITATPQKDTQLIDINLKWDNAKEGRQILEALSSSFIEEVKNIYPTVNVMIMDKIKEPKEVALISERACVIIGILAGISLSLLVIYWYEFMDDTIREEDDIEKYLNLHVLSNIPKVGKIADSITMGNLKSLNYSLAESYRTLRINIEFSSINKRVKSLIVTSPMSGDGKSVSSAMLAVHMALAGKKTIWVDCDMRGSKTKNLFNIHTSVGFTDVLLGNATLSEAVEKNEIDNLYVLTSGLKPSNTAEILCSEKTNELIDTLKNDFEYVIIDTPPVGLMNDAQILSRYVDGCLLVMASGKPKIKEAIRSKRLIELVQGRILGVVLNKYPHRIFR